MAVSTIFTFGILITRPRPKTVIDWKALRNSPAKRFCINLFAVSVTSVVLSYIGWWCRIRKWNDQPFLPLTPYPIGDLDQVVALTAGILTVVLSTADAFSSRNLFAWEAFEDWRQRSDLFLNDKVLADEEAAAWKVKMQSVDVKVNEIFKIKERNELERLMKQHADRLKAEEDAKRQDFGSTFY